MEELNETLSRLSTTFVVRDIMVDAQDLLCAESVDSALQFLVKYPDFDVVPLRQSDTLVGYLERGEEKLQHIQVADLLSDTTSILDLIEVLKERTHIFVLVRNRVAGYVHFSDLNKQVVKIPFFVLLEAVERHFVDQIEQLLTKEILKEVLDPKRYDIVAQKMENMKNNRSNLGWVSLLYFKEILLCAKHLGKLHIRVSKIDTISKVRNLVCHVSTEELVESHEHVRRLSGARKICVSLLQGENKTI